MEKENKIGIALIKSSIDPEQIKKAKETLLLIRNKAKTIFHNKKDNKKINILIASVVLIIALYRWIVLYKTISDLNNDPYILEKTQQYNLDNLKTNPLTRNSTISAVTIYDLIKNNEDIKDETKRYNKYKENLFYPYTNFLQYILLPRLNIRKDPYTNNLNTNILGKTFLEENPYNDINLLQKRSNFFSSTEQNEINQIRDIEIADIREYDDGTFGIKIDFSFISPSKNALLFLTDKITTTSDEENIWLLGEFFYYLRQQIKLDRKELIDSRSTSTGSILSGETDIDKMIWYEIYQRALNGIDNNIIDNTTINRTIFTMMGCSPETENQCFYKFRTKYRNIAALAYTVGIEDNQIKSEELRNFIKNLPPILSVNDFVYNKIYDNSILKQNGTKYQWNISLEIYGQSISPEERDEIAKKLGEQCLGEDTAISAEEALNIIDENIRKKTNIIDENQTKSNSIRDLRTTIENINTDFNNLNNYKKTIRLFEIYRMLNENGVCKTI